MKRILLSLIFISLLTPCFAQPKEVIFTESEIRSLTESPNTIKGAIYADPTASPDARTQDVMRRLTFEEKVKFCGGYRNFSLYGVERLGLRPGMMADASQGIRLDDSKKLILGNGPKYTTSFPGMIALASTWNKDLANRFGLTMGEECQAIGVDILLGPGINIPRLSTSGRTYEYMGEDPYLTGVISTEYVKGLQSKGIIATAKHFIGNDQEFCRHCSSTNMDDRTLREIYMLPFEMAIKEGGLKGVMSGHNAVNQIPVMLHKPLLNDILRKEFGFKGIVMTDWQNTNYFTEFHDLVFPSTQTLLMPRNDAFRKWINEQCAISESRKNEIEIMLEKMIYPNIYTMFESGAYDRAIRKPEMFNTFEEHKTICRDIAAESIVMLKNSKHILPISKNKSILLMGPQEPHTGTGSGYVIGYDHTDFYAGLKKVYPDIKCIEKPSDKEIRQADVVIYRLNKVTGETKDTPFEEPIAELDELRRVSRLNKNIVVLVNSCNPMPTDWVKNVKGVLWCWFLGQERGNALASIISGEISPCGKLPFTIEKKFADSPAPKYNYIGGKPYWWGDNKAYKKYWLGQAKSAPDFSDYIKPRELVQVDYTEGVFMGYRWYDSKGIEPSFHFGYGLSYTDFEFSNLEIVNDFNTDGEVKVSVTVKNTGKKTGKEVVQLYVSDPEASVARPEKELKEFAKIELKPGEEKTLDFTLNDRSFAFWSETENNWKVENGTYLIRVGNSSNNLPLEKSILIK